MSAERCQCDRWQDWIDERLAIRLLRLLAHYGQEATTWEKPLSEMELVVPRQILIELIEPYYPKASKKGGRPSYPLALMLRIYPLQQFYMSSDPSVEEALRGCSKTISDHHWVDATRKSWT